MPIPENSLEEIASQRKIRVHEPLAEFLHANQVLHSFEISLLDCYRFAGHACHAITGAFLVTDAAVKKLFPETLVCVRGDLAVDFGSALSDHPTGPRSNVISFVTGAWGESGFAGLKGNFSRKNLVTYSSPDVSLGAIRFRRVSTKDWVTLEYVPSIVTNQLGNRPAFPESWRAEICAVLENPGQAVVVRDSSGSSPSLQGADESC